MLRQSYGYNKRADAPLLMSLCGLRGRPDVFLKKICGFPDKWIGVYYYILLKVSQTVQVEIHSGPYLSVYPASQLVYLTADAEHELSGLEKEKVQLFELWRCYTLDEFVY